MTVYTWARQNPSDFCEQFCSIAFWFRTWLWKILRPDLLLHSIQGKIFFCISEYFLFYTYWIFYFMELVFLCFITSTFHICHISSE